MSDGNNGICSGKMQVLVKLLQAIEKEEGGSKVLLFSYSTTVLDIMEAFVQGQGEFNTQPIIGTRSKTFVCNHHLVVSNWAD